MTMTKAEIAAQEAVRRSDLDSLRVLTRTVSQTALPYSVVIEIEDVPLATRLFPRAHWALTHDGDCVWTSLSSRRQTLSMTRALNSAGASAMHNIGL